MIVGAHLAVGDFAEQIKALVSRTCREVRQVAESAGLPLNATGIDACLLLAEARKIVQPVVVALIRKALS